MVVTTLSSLEPWSERNWQDQSTFSSIEVGSLRVGRASIIIITIAIIIIITIVYSHRVVGAFPKKPYLQDVRVSRSTSETSASNSLQVRLRFTGPLPKRQKYTVFLMGATSKRVYATKDILPTTYTPDVVESGMVTMELSPNPHMHIQEATFVQVSMQTWLGKRVLYRVCLFAATGIITHWIYIDDRAGSLKCKTLSSSQVHERSAGSPQAASRPQCNTNGGSSCPHVNDHSV